VWSSWTTSELASEEILKVHVMSSSKDPSQIVMTSKKTMQAMDCVIHLAACISVPESVEKPVGYQELNMQDPLNLLNSAARHEIEKQFFVNSAAVYRDSPIAPKEETREPDTKSPMHPPSTRVKKWLKNFTITENSTPAHSAS